MDALNIVVIYLACGAPFAVHYSFRVVERFSFADLVKCVCVGLVWPIVAIQIVIAGFRSKGDHRLNVEADRYRTRLESAVDLATRPDLAFEFRDTVMRYVGLQLAKPDPTSAPAEENLVAIIDHPTTALASACFARRTARLIDEHAKRASAEFSETVDRMNVEGLHEVAASVRRDLGEKIDQSTSDPTLVTTTQVAQAA